MTTFCESDAAPWETIAAAVSAKAGLTARGGRNLADGFGGADEFSSTPGAASWGAISAAVSAEAGFESRADAEFCAPDAPPIAASAAAEVAAPPRWSHIATTPSAPASIRF